MTSQYTANKFGNTYGSCKKKSEARPPSHPHPIFSGIRPFRKLALSPTRPIRINTISSTRPGTYFALFLVLHVTRAWFRVGEVGRPAVGVESMAQHILVPHNRGRIFHNRKTMLYQSPPWRAGFLFWKIRPEESLAELTLQQESGTPCPMALHSV